ncbi:MAG: gamma-glutamyl phosphate reductase [Candidatus Binatia bacterium]|nr:MAG: gamma-glutamyl phosphate reductase [Candidatus Binatia bacterium]
MGKRMDVHATVIELCRNARKAAQELAKTTTDRKNRCLTRLASELRSQQQSILRANGADLEAAREQGLSAALIDRLRLDPQRIEGMARGVEVVSALPDPVGETIACWRRPNGLEIAQVRIPIGVVGIIYESRPGVTIDAGALCLKSGNAVILKGGSEAWHTNRVLADIFAAALRAENLPPEAVQVLPTTERTAVQVLLQQTAYIDVVIPRGGESLIRAITEMSRVPVIQHYAGVCHTYVDEFADLKMAEEICYNAKVQRPGVCNAMETMLVHERVAEQFLPPMVRRFEAAQVEIRGCERTRSIVPHVRAASEEDWRTEYLDLILAVKVVSSLDEAISFINTYGTGHSDAIVTNHYEHARRFQREVDSAAVYVNASTRFTDGYEFGFGAEVGISTNRLHARGPMGLRELTTYKYVISGNGQIRT